MAMVLLLLTFCLLLLPLWESVIVLCFVVRYFMSFLVLLEGRESWLFCFICLPGVSWWLSGSSSRCHGVFPDHTHSLFLKLSITNGIVSSKIYDQQDDFNFEIVNFSFLDEDVPCSPSYVVYISRLIHFARACSNVDDFNNRNFFNC